MRVSEKKALNPWDRNNKDGAQGGQWPKGG